MAFAKLACLNHFQQRLVFEVQIVKGLYIMRKEKMNIFINFSI